MFLGSAVGPLVHGRPHAPPASKCPAQTRRAGQLGLPQGGLGQPPLLCEEPPTPRLHLPDLVPTVSGPMPQGKRWQDSGPGTVALPAACPPPKCTLDPQLPPRLGCLHLDHAGASHWSRRFRSSPQDPLRTRPWASLESHKRHRPLPTSKPHRPRIPASPPPATAWACLTCTHLPPVTPPCPHIPKSAAPAPLHLQASAPVRTSVHPPQSFLPRRHFLCGALTERAGTCCPSPPPPAPRPGLGLENLAVLLTALTRASQTRGSAPDAQYTFAKRNEWVLIVTHHVFLSLQGL